MVNYTLATNSASQILLQQSHINTFPINPKDIHIPNPANIFCTFQEYSALTKVSLKDLTYNYKFTDGYTIKDIRPNTNIVLYNNSIISNGRINWTNSHELGHIVLNHKSHTLDNEKEANAFASQLLIPKCILIALIKENVKVTSSYLVDNFGLSEKASNNAISSLKYLLNRNHKDDIYDEALLIKFSDFLSSKTSNFLNSYLDDRESQRNMWK